MSSHFHGFYLGTSLSHQNIWSRIILQSFWTGKNRRRNLRKPWALVIEKKYQKVATLKEDSQILSTHLFGWCLNHTFVKQTKSSFKTKDIKWNENCHLRKKFEALSPANYLWKQNKLHKLSGIRRQYFSTHSGCQHYLDTETRERNYKERKT